ncbi:MAG: FecR domain-containing protein [Proteobacteria bacterium]|nr:FecR domain-containing protein [Pseudomonadota bacterium]
MRKRTPFYLSKSGMLTALIAAMFSPHAYAAPAGLVDFVQGTASATGSDGNPRVLGKGTEVNSGDIITVGDGRAQIRMSDGSYLALRPHTIFKIDDYQFNGKADGSEKGFFSLVKGGLRTISGLIGKTNKQNYKLSTPNATIGIRGTAWDTVFCNNDCTTTPTPSGAPPNNGLYVQVYQGIIAVSNPAGSQPFSAGQFGFIPSPNSAPSIVTPENFPFAFDVPPPREAPPPLAGTIINTQLPPFASGDQLTSSGLPAGLPVGPVLTSGPGFWVSYATPSGVYDTLPNTVTATFDANQTLTSFSSGSSFMDFSGGTAAPAPESGGDGIIGWGRWTGNISSADYLGSGNYGADNGIHYVVGMPTPTTTIQNMHTTAIYTLVGATQPSTFNGSTYSLGTFSGSATVVFNGPSTSLTLNASIVDSAAGINYNLASFYGSMPLSVVTSPNTAVFTASGYYGPSCAALTINGLFAGANAERLGIAYRIDNQMTSKITTGAAAFKTP